MLSAPDLMATLYRVELEYLAAFSSIKVIWPFPPALSNWFICEMLDAMEAASDLHSALLDSGSGRSLSCSGRAALEPPRRLH